MFFFKGVLFSASKGMLNCKCETSFKFILKGKKLSNISKAFFIIRFSIKAIYKVKSAFIINNFKIIYYKVYYLIYLITFRVLYFYKVLEVIIVNNNLEYKFKAFKIIALILKRFYNCK